MLGFAFTVNKKISYTSRGSQLLNHTILKIEVLTDNARFCIHCQLLLSCDDLIHFTPQSSSKSYNPEDSIHPRTTLFRAPNNSQAGKPKTTREKTGTRSQSLLVMVTKATIQTEINRLVAARNQVKQTVTKTTSERDSRKKELDRLYQAITRKREQQLHAQSRTMQIFGFGKTPQEREHEE
jgi:hypothetical protein